MVLKNQEILIKHADWPYILKTFVVYLILIAAGSYYIYADGYLIYVIILSAFLLTVNLFHVYRLQQQEIKNLYYNVQAINEIYKFLPLRAPLPPMIGWAATPGFAAVLHKQIQIHRPKCIVEFGSGISTLISAYSIELLQYHGTIISIEHDAIFAEKTEAELQLHQLSNYVDLRIAELKEIKIDNKTWKWYNTDQIQFDMSIDLAVIDGPPDKTQKNARYPALPVLFEHLSKNAVVIMHDAYRKTEIEVIKRWQKKYPDFNLSVEYEEKGIAIFKRSE